MNDLFHKLTKWMDYNRGTLVAYVLISVVIGGVLFSGCASKTIGLVPNVEVTRVELNQQVINSEASFAKREAELTAVIASLNADKLAEKQKVDAAITELDKQDEFKANLIEIGGQIGMDLAAGTLNPLALIPIAVGISGLIYGGGKKIDNVRKDAVIAERKV